MEADFLREYRLDLVDQLDSLSWRRFTVLLSGLSPQSAFLNAMVRKKKEPRAILLTDPRAIAASIRAKART